MNASEETPLLTGTIPSTGERPPAIGLGTWRSFDVASAAPGMGPLGEVLAAFSDMRGRIVDTSPMYGHAESAVGELVASRNLRPRLFIATKVWTPGKAAGLRQVEASMRKLHVERLDLLQVHNLLDVATQLPTLRNLKEAGRVRYIGVTHYTADAHDAVAEVLDSEPMDFVQINYSVYEREAEDRVLPLARDRGIAVIANRPFASGGAWRRLRNRPLPAWAAELACDSWAQLLLKFVVAHPAVTCAIPATAKPEHLRDNLRALHGALPDAAMRERIAAAAR